MPDVSEAVGGCQWTEAKCGGAPAKLENGWARSVWDRIRCNGVLLSVGIYTFAVYAGSRFVNLCCIP